MKCSESWLREWVNPPISKEVLCNTLTMAGLEVDELAPISLPFHGVVIGEIKKITKHPEADKLNICEVDIGSKDYLTIVCGATNVKCNMKVAVAMIDAILPHDKHITLSSIRNVLSHGMLCSANELGLPEESSGLLELSADAPIGVDLRQYLNLDDYTIDVSITPNRGDCLSVRGLAREISALTKTSLTPLVVEDIKAKNDCALPVNIHVKSACPRYVFRIIRNIRADIETPQWLKNRLKQSGIRSINPIVDVTNYVMLELGQPMHAFDLSKLNESIHVRLSKANEKIVLLNGSEINLNEETLLIADKEKPLAIAGVMGGLDSSVTSLTKDIFLESAYFNPQTIAKQRQCYHLNSDSAYRFERGVDPTMQQEAMHRATQLILALVGGDAGPLNEIYSEEYLPQQNVLQLSRTTIAEVLGISIEDERIEHFLHALNFSFNRIDSGWQVKPPLYRFDITLQEDLVEEIARLYGYDHIPTYDIKSTLRVNNEDESQSDWSDLRAAFRNNAYHEVITYSFVEKKLQALFDPLVLPHEVLNPITNDMVVMRTNLFPGLISTFLYNRSRQQHRVRLFEIGTCFLNTNGSIDQPLRLGGLITGSALPDQWSTSAREVDFFDLKGDLESILHLYIPSTDLKFKPAHHSALHPGQAASIFSDDHEIGMIGALHPKILESLDITDQIYVFEVDLKSLPVKGFYLYREISKFPEIRRDIAIIVNEAIPSSEIQDTIKTVAGDWLKDVFIFDVYQGTGITPGFKSIALALILQHPTRTLVDDEIAASINTVIEALKGQLGAELRS